jgi:ribosomal protein S18 acetylase RimI-like enzyme
MAVTQAVASDLRNAALCLTAAFAQDPITGFLLQTTPGYPERLMTFFSLLMRARIALDMPVLVARAAADIQGVAMGYTTLRPKWPADVTEEWDQFEKATPGLADRLSIYEHIAEKFQPAAPHFYLGAIGVDPGSQGLSVGTHLIKAFCDRSANDPVSSGVYLETANESNLAFYARAGFVETGRGALGDRTLWCLYQPHGNQR